MEVLDLIIHLIDDIFIRGLFISVLSIMVAGKVFKTDTHYAFVIIKGLILVYTALNICFMATGFFHPATGVSFWQRATGAYNWSFYLMFVPNTILPLFLLVKNLGRNKYFVLVLSFLMNIGWIFELLVIYRTDFARENVAGKHLSLNFLWFILLEGFFVGSVIYAIGRALKRKTPELPNLVANNPVSRH